MKLILLSVIGGVIGGGIGWLIGLGLQSALDISDFSRGLWTGCFGSIIYNLLDKVFSND